MANDIPFVSADPPTVGPGTRPLPRLDRYYLTDYPEPSTPDEAALILHLAAELWRRGESLTAHALRGVMLDVSLDQAGAWLYWLSCVMPGAWLCMVDGRGATWISPINTPHQRAA